MSSAASTPSFEIGVKIVDGQPVVFATGELPARLAEQVAGHLLELAKATREESRGDFLGNGDCCTASNAVQLFLFTVLAYR